MKTIIESIAALVAVSGVARAAGGEDLRSSDNHFGEYSPNHNVQSKAVDSNAIAIVKDSAKPLTAFERMTNVLKENHK